MPAIGPESYAFWLYVCYQGTGKTKPRLEVYWNARRTGSPTSPPTAEPDVFMHAQNENFETKVAITRTVVENAQHQSTKQYRITVLEGEVYARCATQSALDYLDQVYDQEYYNFMTDCWTCAQFNLSSRFPKVFPPS
jgi:hypothetical protein